MARAKQIKFSYTTARKTKGTAIYGDVIRRGAGAIKPGPLGTFEVLAQDFGTYEGEGKNGRHIFRSADDLVTAVILGHNMHEGTMRA